MIQRAIGWWKRRGPSALILLYHRVTQLTTDRWSIAVTPERFDEHMALLRRRANPIPLATVDALVDGGSIPENAVVVTFDDGYADNLHAALPILRRHEIPATVFVTPDAVVTGCEFWWDELERIVSDPARLPPTIELMLGGTLHRWSVSDPVEDLGSGSASASGAPANTQGTTIFDSLWKALRNASAADRAAAMATLRALVGEDGTPRATHRALSCEELCRLAADPLIEVGAHSATHSRLGALTASEQQEEIGQGRTTLEALIGHQVTSFAYPFGRPGDYTDETMHLVRRGGFARACINQSGRVDRSTDRFALPRLYVRDWDVDRFATALRDHGVDV